MRKMTPARNLAAQRFSRMLSTFRTFLLMRKASLLFLPQTNCTTRLWEHVCAASRYGNGQCKTPANMAYSNDRLVCKYDFFNMRFFSVLKNCAHHESVYLSYCIKRAAQPKLGSIYTWNPVYHFPRRTLAHKDLKQHTTHLQFTWVTT